MFWHNFLPGNNFHVQSGTPKVSYFTPFTASFLASFAANFWFLLQLIKLSSDKLLTLVARGAKKLAEKGAKYDTFGVQDCTYTPILMTLHMAAGP